MVHHRSWTSTDSVSHRLFVDEDTFAAVVHNSLSTNSVSYRLFVGDDRFTGVVHHNSYTDSFRYRLFVGDVFINRDGTS